MNEEFPRTGVTYRERVPSELGCEDWEYANNQIRTSNGTILYAMKNDLGVYYFSEEEIRQMEIVG